jgi:phospholipase C
MSTRLGARGALLAVMTIVLAFAGPAAANAESGSAGTASPIEHFIYVMQGDRTFDNYFGAYPGADGIPAGTCQEFVAGQPNRGCVEPFVLDPNSADTVKAGPELIDRQWNDGAMNRFVAAFSAQARDGSIAMGHYDEAALPLYWELARQYTLFDKFFSSSRLGERDNRNYWVAAQPVPNQGAQPGGYTQQTIFDRLQASGVSWKFYVEDYDPGQNYRAITENSHVSQPVRVPLLTQDRFIDDPALSSHIVDLTQYSADLLAGTLPAVSFVSSSSSIERSALSLRSGQRLVGNLITQLMMSTYWEKSALLLSYDGPGGWYDHVPPPQIDGAGYGLRVPALLVGPYVRPGVVNSTILDSTSALAFIERNWGVTPLTERDANATSIEGAFDFASPPRPAVVLPPVTDKAPTTVAAPATDTAGAATAIYSTYGVAAALVLLLTLSAPLAPLLRRLMYGVRRRGRHRASEEPEKVLVA